MLIFVGLSYLILSAFSPQQKNFENRFQYFLYNAWQKKAEDLEKISAMVGPDEILQKYRTKDSKLVEVNFIWDNQKIISQKERIGLNFPSNIQQYKNVLEEFLYYLNTSQKIFLEQFLKDAKFSLEHNQGGLDSLWVTFQDKRFELKTIKWEYGEDTLTFFLTSFEDELIIIKFPYSLQQRLTPDNRIKMGIDSRMKERGEDNSLLAFLHEDYDKVVRRELFNNQIEDVKKFLRYEFPNHKISQQGDEYFLKKGNEPMGLKADMAILAYSNNDNYEFKAIQKYTVKNGILKLNQLDDIEVGALGKETINSLALYFPQLIYMHRALGSRLLNFLLIKDDVPTTLILHDDKRYRLEYDNYSDLILRLNKFWKERNIYFSLQDVRESNGFVEFRGILAAVEKELYDLAEIRFHLNREHKIDLIMMSIHVNKKR